MTDKALMDNGLDAKTDYIQLRVDKTLKLQAKAAAEADGRTLSNWITTLIKRELNK